MGGRRLRIAVCLVGLGAMNGAMHGAPAAAQALSDSELTARFIAQREAMRALEQDPGQGASRGLVLTPVDPGQEAASGTLAPPPGDAVTPAPPEGGTVTLAPPEGGTVALAPPEAGAPAVSTTTYVEMPKGDDVFVQVTFGFDSAALAADQKPRLQQICNVLDAAGVGVLRIVGHTDAAGPARYNQKLSVLRAEEVKRYFVNDCGIAADRLQAVGVGEQFPYDEADPMADTNRRVEFQAMS